MFLLYLTGSGTQTVAALVAFVTTGHSYALTRRQGNDETAAHHKGREVPVGGPTRIDEASFEDCAVNTFAAEGALG